MQKLPSDIRWVSLFSEESIMVTIVVDCETKGKAMCFLCEPRVCGVIHLSDGWWSYSPWISRTAGEPRSPLTTGAAALAALTRRLPLSRSAAVAAAAIHPVCLPFVPRDPRMVALAQQKTCSMIVIKVRMKPST